jgi:arylsulfatase A-like enzyme
MRYLQLLIALTVMTLSSYSYSQCGGPVPLLCDADGNFEVNQDDIEAIALASGTPATEPADLRDIDGDGTITILDARQCVAQCTVDGCRNPWEPTPDELAACAEAEQDLADLLALLPPRPIGPNQPVVWEQGPETPVLQPDDRQPNIIVILADDMGFNDVSYYNGDAAASLPTPGIDDIATQGVAFSNGYASHATCAPARAAIMTGRYPTRFGYEFTPMPDSAAVIFDLQNACNFDPLPTDVYPGIADSNAGISKSVPPSEIFFAEKLRDAGYHNGHIGKWHLGRAAGTTPLDKGFDETLEMNGNLYLPEDSPDVVNNYTEFSPLIQRAWLTGSYGVTWQNGARMEPDGYLTDYFTNEAVKFIEANKNRPFFLHLSHWGVHSPLQATQADYDALSHITDERTRVYAGMIRALDRGVAQVMQALVDNGIDNNTLVIFTSDNGGASTIGVPDINAPYRGFKGTFFEGGTHVPYFMRWPKVIPAGGTYDGNVSHMDVFATAAAAAGASLPTGITMDSVNLLPYVTPGAPTGEPHGTLFWRNGFYYSVLSDSWKMSVSDRPDKVWLYDLSVDPLETNNLADVNASKVAELQALIDAHELDQVGPLWQSFIQGPFRVDKTQADEQLPTDEHVYWMN